MSPDLYNRLLDFLRFELQMLIESSCLQDGKGGWRRETADPMEEEALAEIEGLIEDLERESAE